MWIKKLSNKIYVSVSACRVVNLNYLMQEEVIESHISYFNFSGSSYVSGGYNSGAVYNSLQAPASPPPSIGRNEPYFDPATPRNVTALVGKSAYLGCKVRNLGNKTVNMILFT